MIPLLNARGSPVGAVNPPSTWGRNFSFFCISVKFAAFANMMDNNRTITYVSDSTSGNYSDYLWTTSRASEVPTPTDMAIEKSGGG